MQHSPAIISALRSGAMLMNSSHAWYEFGFRTRPTPGRYLKLIRSSWRNDLEDRVSRVLFCCGVAAHIAAGRLPLAQCIDVLHAATADPAQYKAMGFACRTDAVTSLADLIHAFAEREPTRWGAIISRRLHLSAVVDHDVKRKLVHGAVSLTASLRQMIHQLANTRDRNDHDYVVDVVGRHRLAR